MDSVLRLFAHYLTGETEPVVIQVRQRQLIKNEDDALLLAGHAVRGIGRIFL